MSDFSAIDKAFHNKIASDETVASMLSEFDSQPAVFFGSTPKGAEFPYIRIFEITGKPFDTHSSRGESPLYQVSIFARSSYEAKDIMSAVDSFLYWGLIEPEGYDCLVILRMSGPRGFFEKDEEVCHISADYQVTLEES